MQEDLNIRGETIQSMYAKYRKGIYIVNRRYQRKLVWTLMEKQKFIDSILNKYPVPLFLGVNFDHHEKGRCFEILDGMQRLHAITSFIDGEFSVNGYFFDLSIVAETNKLLKEKILVQREPKLSFEDCSVILNYPLPISTTIFTSSQNVDETFRRINTGGVRLSRQEVRQAGIISNFSQLVRKCSIYIRGDVSHTDIIELDKMKNISLTTENNDNGIKIQNTFWHKNRILTLDNILASRDEELVSHLILHILLGDGSQTSSRFLDEVYLDNHPNSNTVNDAILKYNSDNLYKTFCHVFNELNKVINEFPNEYCEYIYKEKPIKIQNSYQVLFLAFYELLIIKNKKIQNYREVSKLLKHVASNHMGGILNNDYKWLSRDRERLKQAICGVISHQFIAREGLDPTSQSYVDNLENILTQSTTENICYDFKIGFHSFVNDQFNNKLFSKVIKTLTAMSNSHAGENFVIIGVADNKDDARKYEEKYNSPPKTYKNFFITGIDSEALNFHRSIDQYQQKIQQLIEKEPIDEEIKRKIARNVLFFKYYDKHLIMFKIIRGETPISYDGKLYVRKIANTDPNDVKDTFAFYKEFMEQSSRYPYN